MTLAGTGVIGTAPGASGSLINDVVMTCTLDSVPNQANLPESPAFHRSSAKRRSARTPTSSSSRRRSGKSTMPLAFATGQQMLVNLDRRRHAGGTDAHR